MYYYINITYTNSVQLSYIMQKYIIKYNIFYYIIVLSYVYFSLDLPKIFYIYILLYYIERLTMKSSTCKIFIAIEL